LSAATPDAPKAVMIYDVTIRPEAEQDLQTIYDLIAEDNPSAAIAFIRRLRELCRSLDALPRRGVPRDDLRPGLRILGVERRAVIAYRIVGNVVEVTNIFYGGRDYEAILRRLNEPE
jgi:toxin ParE1/3/4